MTSFAYYALAAVAEIGGCFAFWAWLRLDRNILWTLPGLALLIVFAIALTRVDAAFAGRTFASYGGVYIVASLLWLWAIEGMKPDRWDVAGATISLIGAIIIFAAPRPA
jgi:small multidrug resistance family-3 protein